MIYFDQAATTKLHPIVSEFMKEHLDYDWMNPSSMYAAEKLRDIEICKQKLLGMIGADLDDCIIFTSGGSEANSLMVNSAGYLITTAIEHDSILNSEKEIRMDVDASGFIDVDTL